MALKTYSKLKFNYCLGGGKKHNFCDLPPHQTLQIFLYLNTQYSTMQHYAAQYSTIQHYAAQYSTIQLKKVPLQKQYKMQREIEESDQKIENFRKLKKSYCLLVYKLQSGKQTNIIQNLNAFAEFLKANVFADLLCTVKFRH